MIRGIQLGYRPPFYQNFSGLAILVLVLSLIWWEKTISILHSVPELEWDVSVLLFPYTVHTIHVDTTHILSVQFDHHYQIQDIVNK